MINFQRTINEEGNLEGIGLHTGKKVKIKVCTCRNKSWN